MDWYESSGAHVLAARSTVTYHELCTRAASPGAVLEADSRQIDLDVPRTGVSLYRFVLHEDVNEDVDLDLCPLAPHFDALKRILLAYSLRNMRVGYVQGHADVVSFLMGLTSSTADDKAGQYDDEQVFWIYAVLMERIFPSDFFARMPKLQGFHVDMDVFARLIQSKVPALASVLAPDDLHVLSSLLASKWFMTVWVGEIPLAALTAYWHYMLVGNVETSSVAHFIMALSLLELATDAILASVRENDGDASFGYKVALEHAAHVDANTISSLLRFNKYMLTDAVVESMRADVRSNPHFIEQEVCALHGITHFDRSQLEHLQVEFQFLVATSHHPSLSTTATTTTLAMGPTSVARRSQTIAADGINKDVLRQILVRVIPEALSVLCRGSTEEKMRLCFDLYDVDKSGYLCVEKMINMAASLCEIYQNKVAPVPLVVLAPPNAPAPRRASASAHGVNQGGESDAPTSGPTRRKGRSCSSDATHRWNSPSFGSLCDGVDHRHDGDPDEYEASLLDRFDRVLPVAFLHKLLRMDVDGDHKLSFKEWSQGARTEPLILRCFEDDVTSVQDPLLVPSAHRHRRSSRGSDMHHRRPRRRSNSSDCLPLRSTPPSPSDNLALLSSTPSKRKDGGRISLLSPTSEFHQFSSAIQRASQQPVDKSATESRPSPPPVSPQTPPTKRSMCEGCVIL
ncbi:hypothetical protein DYB25_008601 [Aphanomyces astaci]|uniref:Uncharacterized protein n=2 Tax=Aphanomyces astaci TaxID=112090 RepID=A0A397BPL9_APHAT|nr:hypothetical protein DYB25_008601 [Aphanomyces astaci]RHY61942.1 hypothetical protein DYB30_002226 [Aphanomyces astaci]RHY74263.1 hypothetical protein DYB34_003515 [Aphanomyces astaci]